MANNRNSNVDLSIQSASDVNMSASANLISKFENDLKQKIATGKYREYDVKTDHAYEDFMKKHSLIIGSLLVIGSTLLGLGTGTGVDEDREFDKEYNKTKAKIEADMQRLRKRMNESLSEELISENTVTEHEINELSLNVIRENYESLNDEEFELVKMFNEEVAGKIAGTLVGAAVGKGLHSLYMNELKKNLNYKIFKVKGLTIFSVISQTNWTGQLSVASTTYSIYTNVKTGKTKFLRINLVPKTEK